jgi:Lysyl oxidase
MILLSTLVAASAAAVVLVTVLVTGKSADAAASDLLPDLEMAKLTNIQIQNRTNGRRWLRFDTVITNTGAGKFELHGSRPSTAYTNMSVSQWIFNSAGGYRIVGPITGAQMYYAGDGHNHWHVRNLERYTLTRLSDGTQVGTGAKQGFCFYDNVRFGSTQSAYYNGCGNNQPGALKVKVGLSRGWGDKYGWKLVGQYIDITGLPDGSYRLKTTADPSNWFVESSDDNNETWADLLIQGKSVTVLQYGPSAQPI